MQIPFILGYVLLFGSLSTAQQWDRKLAIRQNTKPKSDEPCGKLAAIVNPLRAAHPNGSSPTAPAELALACLNSVPLHRDEALNVTRSLIPYAQFQSDLAFKKNPPPGYPMKPIDIIGSLTQIAENLTKNVYPNEYSWQLDVYKTFMSAKDGHFRFIGDLVAKVARFERRVGLVSVSLDGVALPQIYLLDDINKTQALGQKFKPSEVTLINGIEAVAFMESESDFGLQQDADTAYNTMFYSLASNYFPNMTFQYGYFGGDQRQGLQYPGPTTTIRFANNSEIIIPTVARVVGNLTAITDGESVYQKFCRGRKPKKADDTAAPFNGSFISPDSVKVPGWPKAHVLSSDLSVSGYYLDGPAFKDVGVLVINNFGPDRPREFQAVVQTMIADMKKDGKKKLVIDLSINPGGTILVGVDTFRQLFPTTPDQNMGRFRIQPALTEMYESVAALIPNKPFDVNTGSITEAILRTSHYYYGFDMDLKRKHFNAAPDKFNGPKFNDDTYSNLIQFDFNDPYLTINETTGVGMEMTGYGNRTKFAQPFAPEDIVMLYDGQCASTCVLFSELMRIQGKVKSISMGGRPNNKQIQTIGGVKGASDNEFPQLFKFVDFIRGVMNENNTGVSKTPALDTFSDLPINRSVDTALNMQDLILPTNLQDGIPAQYVNEPADCRLYYTPPMIMSMAKLWEAAADAAFNGKPCVAGGISKGNQGKKTDKKASKRAEIKQRQEEMPLLRRASADARKLLMEARSKPPPKREWDLGLSPLRSRGVPRFGPSTGT